MARWTPDPSFYPSPRLAMEAPQESLAYVALLEPDQTSGPDALGVIDLERGSDTYGQIVSTTELGAVPSDRLGNSSGVISSNAIRFPRASQMTPTCSAWVSDSGPVRT